MRNALSRTLALASALAPPVAAVASATPPHILFITADDLGYNDLGALNGGLTFTPAIDALRASGVVLSDYHTFKICSPSRASVLSGRYPFNVGFYDMSVDDNHHLSNYTLLPALLRSAGYATHALGKYDVGFMVREATPTYRGFDSFYGYYEACNADYWYHSSPTCKYANAPHPPTRPPATNPRQTPPGPWATCPAPQQARTALTSR